MAKETPSGGNTSVEIGNMVENHQRFKNNYIRTTKYTALSFIPLALFNQFRRYANIYFLIVAILQSIPSISPLSPISSWAPLIFVISLSIIREAFEDLARYRSDVEINAKKTERYDAGQWYLVDWKDVFVGDILRVKEKEDFPADMVVLESSDPKGSCFIMTSSLDGEKNLKPKFAPPETQKMARRDSQFDIQGRINSGPPDENLYSYSGTLEMNGRTIGLGAKQLVIRGASLRNTDYIIGVVVYTGKDTKLMLNSGEPRYKQSQIELKTNYLILGLIVVEVLLCIAAATGSLVWNSKYNTLYAEFIPVRYTAFGEAVTVFFTMFILLTSMIPISLIISLDIVKMMQAYFINKDEDMYDPVEARSSHAFNSSLMEELGQIEYIFSDKTGTLTSNILEFKYAYIGDSFFGDAAFMEDKKERTAKVPTYMNKDEGISFSFNDQRISSNQRRELSKEESFVFKDRQGQELYRIRSLQGLADHFLLTMAACHDVIFEPAQDGEPSKYSGLSPDEVALVDAARHLGYVFEGSTNTGKIITINESRNEIEVLQFFEFDSERKRSSIIIRQDGVIKHLMKGADSIIIQRLDKNNQPYLAKTVKLLERFSLRGLRTLCYSMKVWSPREYEEIERKMRSFDSSTEKQKLINQYASEIEQNFYLLGCTAVEDKLQDKVPETIADCLSADIKVWMLTGDKLETAENIAFSCKLIQDHFKKVYIREGDDLMAKLNELAAVYDNREPDQKISLIVEGPMIIKIANSPELAPQYVSRIFVRSDSVVCCRMSPNGKGEVVSLIKDFHKKITLAIGDGANDVNMIQRAHIGVGLYGREGLRAVQASDFALVEFKGLWKLLFVHGHWAYIRVAEMIQYFYYKNIAIAMPHFFYCCYNAFSGQTVFDDYYITFYNLIFTAWPVLIRGMFDQDLYYKKWTSRDNPHAFDSSHKTLYENKVLKSFYPQLYYVGQKNVIFT